jgi:MFS family permease
MSSFRSDLGISGPDVHLQMLANSDSISAITSSLIKASTKTGVFDASVEMNMIYDESILRCKCVIDCIDILREYANTVNEPFNAFLSRHALIVTGRDLGGIPSIKQRALEILLAFDPDTVLYMEKSDLMEWQQKCWNYSFTSAGNKMRTTSFDLINEDQLGIKTADTSLAWGGSDSISMFLNFLSIFLYTVNYYIAAPTANRYAIYLHADGALGSTLIGASSAAAIFGAFIYSWWYTRFSFKSVLLFSSFSAFIGNTLYALALSFNSMKIAIIGRLFVGLGSAEVVNRQMISSSVHFKHMTKASAQFVVYGAIGMSIGPLVAGILDSVAGRDITIDVTIPFIGGVIVNHVTTPGFLMACAWLVQFTSVLTLYSEPYRINSVHHDQGRAKSLGFYGDLKMVASLVMKNPAVPITLFLFSYIELVCEVLISSCAMTCKRYFLWNGSTAGFLISSLGAFILPAHYIVERASRRFEERAIMKVSKSNFTSLICCTALTLSCFYAVCTIVCNYLSYGYIKLSNSYSRFNINRKQSLGCCKS